MSTDLKKMGEKILEALAMEGKKQSLTDKIKGENTRIADNNARVVKLQAEVDAAAVYVNASTRFTDGFEYGFGAEIGISTQKLHARGPMGLPELTSYKYLIQGTGQIRQ